MNERVTVESEEPGFGQAPEIEAVFDEIPHSHIPIKAELLRLIRQNRASTLLTSAEYLSLSRVRLKHQSRSSENSSVNGCVRRLINAFHILNFSSS